RRAPEPDAHVVEHVTNPQNLLRSAVALEQAGHLAEAEAAYVRVLASWPDLPDTWYNLARLQRQGGRLAARGSSSQPRRHLCRLPSPGRSCRTRAARGAGAQSRLRPRAAESREPARGLRQASRSQCALRENPGAAAALLHRTGALRRSAEDRAARRSADRAFTRGDRRPRGFGRRPGRPGIRTWQDY